MKFCDELQNSGKLNNLKRPQTISDFFQTIFLVKFFFTFGKQIRICPKTPRNLRFNLDFRKKSVQQGMKVSANM